LKKLTVIVLLLMLVMGCSAGGEAPEAAVEKALKAVKSLDEETMNQYFSQWDGFVGSNAEAPALKDVEALKQIFGSIEYKIVSASTDGDKAVVTTEITALDLKPIFGEFLQQSIALSMSQAFAKDNPMSDEELEKQINQMLIDLLKKEDNAKVTSTVELSLAKHENSWKIQPNEAFGNAVFGGLKEMTDAFSGISGENAPQAK